jgi:Zn-dependent metalloprotease
VIQAFATETTIDRRRSRAREPSDRLPDRHGGFAMAATLRSRTQVFASSPAASIQNVSGESPKIRLRMQANGTLGGFIALVMLVACMTLSVSAGLGIAVAQASSTRGSVPPLSGDLQRIERNPDDGRVYGFEVDPDLDVSSDGFFRKYAADLSLGPDDELTEYAREYDGQGYVIHRYEQRYKRIPVFGGSYFLYERDGRVERGHGDPITGLELDATPAIDEPFAFAAVLAALDLQETDVIGNPPAVRPIGELGIVCSGDSEGAQELVYRFRLTSRSKVVDVDAKSGRIARILDSAARMQNFPTPGHGSLNVGLSPRSLRVKGQSNPDCTATYFLAQKGNGTSLPDITVYLAHYAADAHGDPDQAAIVASAHGISETVSGGAGPQQSATDAEGSARSEDFDIGKASAKDRGVPPPAPCTLFVPPDFMNVPEDWQEPIDVLANLETTHDYLFTHFKSPGDPSGTMGYIGADGSTPLSYSVYFVYKNTISERWDDGNLFFSFVEGELMTTDAHEFAHSLIMLSNAGNGGFQNLGEAASLNEAFAYIFETILDSRSYPNSPEHMLLEPDNFYKDGSHGSVDLIDPPLSHFGAYASSYHDAYWIWPPCDPDNDWCGMHVNGGPAMHWFALLVGGERNGQNFGIGVNTLGKPFDVFGIGADDAEKIAFRTMRELGPQPTYMGARAASLAAASSLFPALASGVDSPQYISVMDAWCAVGVGACYGADWDATYGEGVKRIIEDADPWPYRSWIVSKYPYIGAFDFTLSDDPAFTPGRVVTVSGNTDPKGNAYADFNLETGQTYYLSILPTTGNSHCLVNATTEAFCNWMLQKAEASGVATVTTSSNTFALNAPAQGEVSVYPWNTAFGWSAPPSPKPNIPLAQPIKYLLQVAADSDEDFVHPFHTVMITASGSPNGESLTLPILTNKDQRWRVLAVGPNDAIDNQPTFSLSQNDSNAFSTAKVAVTLASPASGTHVPPWGAPLALTWMGNQGAVSYDVCVGDNAMPAGTCSLPYSGVTAQISNIDTAGCGALSDEKKWFIAESRGDFEPTYSVA